MGPNKKNEQEIIGYENTKNDFVVQTYFESEPKLRSIERNAFINNLEYTPNYDYPKLDFLIDKGDLVDKKRSIYEAVLELEVAKQNPDANAAEIELYANFHETRLKRIMLVESARDLCNPISMSGSEVNRQCFAELNEVLYGEFNNSYYKGMISTEKKRLASFSPKSEIATDIKSQLELKLGNMDVGNHHEEALLDEPAMKKLHKFVIERYAGVLGVVPDTSDDVFYDVTQCVEIMNKALKVGGLASRGWFAIENSSKPNPSTKKNVINLPSNTRRTASELRRLIIHEQEVHARRKQNGKDTGFKPIEIGTANYSDIEEGLGTLLECAVDGNFDNPSFDRVRSRYITAGLALGADGTPRDAREVYETLWQIIAVQKADDGDISIEAIKRAKDKAYTHIENAYRGTQFWMKGVIYTKLKVYYEGLVKNAEYFKNNINRLDEAFDDIFIGKYNYTDSTEKELVLHAINAKKIK